jgi:hypothetical protein
MIIIMTVNSEYCICETSYEFNKDLDYFILIDIFKMIKNLNKILNTNSTLL